jgi:DNA repair protein RecO (recombination protein O)
VLKQSRGIVLNYVKYSESGIIVRVFTEEFGLQSYSAKGVRSKRSKTKIALFEPLTQVEIVAYQKDNKTIHNLKEIRAYYSYQSIPIDLHKRSILIFLDELLIKTLKEESPGQALFEWLSHALTWFDLDEGNPMNFHLVFMMQLTRFLGFYPKKEPVPNYQFFNLESGLFTSSRPNSPSFIEGGTAMHFNALHESSFEDAAKLDFTSVQRRKLLDTLIVYYKLHFPGFGEIKSIDVLKTVLG